MHYLGNIPLLYPKQSMPNSKNEKKKLSTPSSSTKSSTLNYVHVMESVSKMWKQFQNNSSKIFKLVFMHRKHEI